MQLTGSNVLIINIIVSNASSAIFQFEKTRLRKDKMLI